MTVKSGRELMITELDIMEIQWNCTMCNTDYETKAPVYEDVTGEYVEFWCPNCASEVKVRLDERED
jgi:predicted RNA-binding Zn-ribbon protein involved in translation (DUF1610 family)